MSEPYPIEEAAEAVRAELVRALTFARDAGTGLFKFIVYHPDGLRLVDVTGQVFREDVSGRERLAWLLAPAVEHLTEAAQKWASEDQAREVAE
ncbi:MULTISPECIES: hypothetical protein [Nocardia]|uniref:hypothetical protein n=1 Tax=Nocardia TaxID=1817 RepID=UPI000D68EA83|nr:MULTISPECIES: hypothetical protein [Nocardia]